MFFAESLSFHEVCGVDITTQTPVQACLLFGEQVTMLPLKLALVEKTVRVFINDRKAFSYDNYHDTSFY